MRIDSKLKSDLAADGARIDATYYCLHHPQATNPTYRLECDCRKPEPGLLLRAIQAYRLNAAECFMIGDNLTDIQAGQRAGCRTVLIGRMKCELCNLMDELRVRPDRISGDLPEAANFILDQEGRHGNLH
jgi:D-glycero-D-manno-heptose 1,7-bisphosphate phosphatase